MGKIKIYDADALIQKRAKMACHTFKQVAIFEGPHGVVVAEAEAVHDRLASLDGEFRFDLTNIPAPGKLYLVPSAYAEIPVRFIKEKAPCTEVDFYDFFNRRNYNPRCMNNFRYMCANLREIGYEIPREPLSQKVQTASTRAAAVSYANRNDPALQRG